MGTTQRKWDFFDASCEPANTSLSEKKNKVKIALIVRYIHIMATDGGGGGGGWQRRRRLQAILVPG